MVAQFVVRERSGKPDHQRHGPAVVVDLLTGDSLPTPRWLAPGVHWLLPVPLAGAILLILFVPGH